VIGLTTDTLTLQFSGEPTLTMDVVTVYPGRSINRRAKPAIFWTGDRAH